MSLMLHRSGLLRPSVGTPANTVPEPFAVDDWSLAPGDETAEVTIHALPGDGGTAITDIEYRVDGGSWNSSATTSSFTISGLTNDQEYDVELRAVNAVGASAASDTKSVTPEGESEGWHPNDLASPPLAVWDPTIPGSRWQDTSATTPAGDGDPLGRINDQSTNGNHLLQSTDTKRPLFDVILDVPWIVCDGIDDGMSFSNVKPAMVAAVFYQPSGLGNIYSTLFCQAENTFTNSVRILNNGSGNWRAPGTGADANDFTYNNGEAKVDGVTGTAYTFNAAHILTMTAGTGGGQSGEGLAGFGLQEFTGRSWKGRLGRAVLLSAAPDGEEYANLLAWLAAPYGISL